MRRNTVRSIPLVIAAAAVTALVTLRASNQAQRPPAAAPPPDQVRAPMFQVDPLWPKPLPEQWVLGSTIGAVPKDQGVPWPRQR